MLDFIFILAAILEILATYFIVVKIIKFEKKINSINENLNLIYGVILELIKKFRKVISKINQVVRIFKNKKFIMIANILKTAITVFQVVILIKGVVNSGSFVRRIKTLNFSVIKRLLLANAIYKLINYVLRALVRVV